MFFQICFSELNTFICQKSVIYGYLDVPYEPAKLINVNCQFSKFADQQHKTQPFGTLQVFGEEIKVIKNHFTYVCLSTDNLNRDRSKRYKRSIYTFFQFLAKKKVQVIVWEEVEDENGWVLKIMIGYNEILTTSSHFSRSHLNKKEMNSFLLILFP